MFVLQLVKGQTVICLYYLSAALKVSSSSEKSPDHSLITETSRNAKTAKNYSTSLKVAILICDVEQAISATLMDSSEVLTPKKKAGIVHSR